MKLGMKYVTRFDHGRSHGWWVRVQRRVVRGDKPLVTSQFFADGLHGGRRAALEAAKIFRDAAIKVAPAPKLLQHQPPGVKNGYGYVTADPTHVKAWYRDTRGKVHRAKYSIRKWSFDDAKKKADSWLDRWQRRRMGRTKEDRAA